MNAESATRELEKIRMLAFGPLDSREALSAVDEWCALQLIQLIALVQRYRPEVPRALVIHRPKYKNHLPTTKLKVERMMAEGLNKRQIAERLKISHSTAHHHVLRIYEDYGVHSRTEFLTKCIRGEQQ